MIRSGLPSGVSGSVSDDPEANNLNLVPPVFKCNLPSSEELLQCSRSVDYSKVGSENFKQRKSKITLITITLKKIKK